jgi:glutathionyl-hydroquinone reductase
MKNQILSSLSSQVVSNTGEFLYKSQGNYSCRHTVPVLPPDKNENTSIFSTSAQFILFLLYSTHSNQPKKNRTEPCYSIKFTKHEDGNSAAFFKSIL